MTFTCTTLRVESALMSSLDPHTDLGALIHAITSIPVSVIQIALIHALYRDGIFTMESLIIAFDSATNTGNRLVEAPIYIYIYIIVWHTISDRSTINLHQDKKETLLDDTISRDQYTLRQWRGLTIRRN